MLLIAIAGTECSGKPCEQYFAIDDMYSNPLTSPIVKQLDALGLNIITSDVFPYFYSISTFALFVIVFIYALYPLRYNIKRFFQIRGSSVIQEYIYIRKILIIYFR
jgi:hypothetical protein